MEMYNELVESIKEITTVKEQNIICKSWHTKGLTMMLLRDYFVVNGHIVQEDLEKNTYLATIKGGLFKMNVAYITVELTEDDLHAAIYAREGLINQHTSEGVINELERAFSQYIY